MFVVLKKVSSIRFFKNILRAYLLLIYTMTAVTSLLWT